MKLPRVLRKSSTQRFMVYAASFLVWLALVAWLPEKAGSVVCMLGLALAFYAYCQWAKDPTGNPPRDFPLFQRMPQLKFDARITALLAKSEQQCMLLRASQKSHDNAGELLRVAQETETDARELLRSK